MLTIKVLGPGCTNCKNVEAITRKAAADLAITFISDRLLTSRSKNHFYTWLVINEKVVCAAHPQ
jgi:hypothetical protein